MQCEEKYTHFNVRVCETHGVAHELCLKPAIHEEPVQQPFLLISRKVLPSTIVFGLSPTTIPDVCRVRPSEDVKTMTLGNVAPRPEHRLQQFNHFCSVGRKILLKDLAFVAAVITTLVTVCRIKVFVEVGENQGTPTLNRVGTVLGDVVDALLLKSLLL